MYVLKYYQRYRRAKPLTQIHLSEAAAWFTNAIAQLC